VGERRVARSEDQVGRAFEAELRPHRRGDVDLGQHAEALGSERRLDGWPDLIERQGHAGSERVAGLNGHLATPW